MITETIKPRSKEALFTELYEQSFPAVATFIHKMGGSFDDAKDIFQDALVIYYEKKADPGFSAGHSDASYVNGIARHLWYKRFRDAKLFRPLAPGLEQSIIEQEEPEVSENLLRMIALSGKKCLDLLKAFYYERLNMKQLAAQFGFSGERSATAQKFKCLEKVRGAVRERSLNKADFYE